MEKPNTARTTVRPLLISSVLLLSVAVISGCTMAPIYSTSGNTVALTTVKQTRGAQSFTIEKRIMFDFISAMDVQELIRSKYGSGVTVQNVTVKVTSDPLDFLLNLVTPRTGAK